MSEKPLAELVREAHDARASLILSQLAPMKLVTCNSERAYNENIQLRSAIDALVAYAEAAEKRAEEWEERLSIEHGLACVRAGHTHGIDDVRRIAELKADVARMQGALRKVVACGDLIGNHANAKNAQDFCRAALRKEIGL